MPAVPLPYIQKRKQQEAVLAKAKEQAATPIVVDVIEAPPSPTPLPTGDISPPSFNGHDENEHESEIVESFNEPSLPATPAIDPSQEGVEIEATADGNSSYEEVPGVQTKYMLLHQIQLTICTERSQDTPRSVPSESQSSVSRSTYQMPPPFIPANQQAYNGTNSDFVTAQPHVYTAQIPMHHGHPSNGGSMIHSYAGSTHSSPAPPPSAGNMPPYPYQQQPLYSVARHASHLSNGSHSQQIPNGYGAMGPPPPPGQFHLRSDGFKHGLVADNFARHQMAQHGPSEVYSSSSTAVVNDSRGNGHAPSTPRSIHGSQSSVPNEHENGPIYYGNHSTAVISNGSNGQINDVRVYHPDRPKPRGPQPIQPPHHVDQLDGLVPYLQSQFADSTFADYTLELRFTDDRAAPVRIPGHGLMFARSPTLRSHMDELAMNSTAEGSPVRLLLLQSGDRFLSSDGFWMAAQRLYGHVLLDHPLLHQIDAHTQLPTPKVDHFKLALGYAAAGHLLQMPPVVSRGIEVALSYLDFSTLERALEFALDGGLDPQWMARGLGDRFARSPTYGPATNVLISQCLNFLVNKFPGRLVLDTSAYQHSPVSRLPLVIESRPTSHNPRLSKIRFGDHSAEEKLKTDEEPLKNGELSGPSTFSRVLLNLPFHLLKHVLESNLPPTVEGWSNPSVRQDLLIRIIDEREKRRLKVYNSQVLDSERLANSREWEAVGWQEQVEPQDANQGFPMLGRKFIGFTKAPMLE
jgi:hypothetical protein